MKINACLVNVCALVGSVKLSNYVTLREKRVIIVKFISFTAMSSSGLTRKVNDFLESHSEIEIIDLKYTASFGNIYVAILYR